MTRTTIMLSEDVKRRAVIEARRLKVSFADFVRQAVAEKLPEHRKGVNRLKRRRSDPLFRLIESLPVAKGKVSDTAVDHDEYLYGDKSEFRKR